MPDFQIAKSVVLNACKAIDAAAPEDTAAALSPFVSSDYRWRGMHPVSRDQLW